MSDPQTEARIIAQLTDLRARLLDVRAVDRWLNVRHSGPLAASVAVVDDSPESLHTRLTAGRDLFFRPVPYPDVAWEREFADDFVSILEEERALDFAWSEALDAGEEPGSARLRALEVDLRARVAQRLGLPCREEHPSQVAEAWVVKQGVPIGDGGLLEKNRAREIARLESELQTMLFAGELKSILANLADQAELLQQQMAQEGLCIALGFLEWNAVHAAGICLRAPLLLYPVERVCRGEGERQRVGVRGLDLPQFNEPLRARLETDFQIQLPVWNSDVSVENYLDRVCEAVAERKDWRVVRGAALGLFPVSPQVMLADVGPRNWGGYQALASSGVLRLLLERPDAEALEAESVEVIAASDTQEKRGMSVPFFMEADADQRQVVRAAFRGRNVRVDAPPGTGATQTMLHVLAAFLAQGKSVLFVSERGSALREVAERAREMGLGPFCVELFGKGLRRVALLEGVVERQRVQPPESRIDLGAIQVEVDARLQQLRDYLALMAQPFGQLEILDRGRWRQLILKDVVWEDVALRAQTPLFAGLDRVWIEDVELLTRADREHRRTRLAALERAAREMREKWGGIDGHPWGFVTRGDIELADVPDVEEVAAQALVRLEELQACGDALIARMRFDVESSTLAEVLDFAKLLQDVPLPPGRTPDLLVRMLLLSPEAAGRVRETLGWLREGQRRREMLASFFQGRAPEIVDEEEWGDAVTEARKAGLGDVPLKEIAAGAEQLRLRVALWEKLKPFIEKCLVTFGLGQLAVTIPLLQRVVQALDLLEMVERRVLLVRTPAILDEIQLPVLEAALQTARHLREAEQRLRKVYAYDVRLTESELREHANSLSGVGLFGKWSASYRRAAGQARALIKQHAGLSDEQLAARLHHLADHLEAMRRFDTDSILRSLLGDRFLGAFSDWESCVEANRFATSVRARFVGQWEPEASLRRFFLQGTMDDFDSALALRADVQFPEMLAFLDGVEGAPVGIEELVLKWEAASAGARRLFRFFGGFGLRAEVTPNEALEVRFCFAELRELREKIEGSPLKTWVGPEAWQSDLTDPELLELGLAYADCLQSRVPAGVVRVVGAGDLDVTSEVEEVRSQGLTLEGGAMRAGGALRALQQWVADPAVPLAVSPVLAPFLTVGGVYAVLRRAQEHGVELSRGVSFRRCIEELRADGLGAFLGAYEEAGQDYVDLEAAYDRVVWRSLARRAVEWFPALGRVQEENLEQTRLQWIELQQRLSGLQRQSLLAQLAEVAVRREESEGPASESAVELAAHLLESGQQGSLREWMDQAWAGIQKAKPCVLASPESVAQVFSSQCIFDLVVIEGASQMRPERALGILARARQAVFFGDEQQLPVSTFIERHASDGMEVADPKMEQTSLWERVSAGVENCALRGQYRAAFAALMAFSNRHFYRNEIRVFPSPREAFAGAECGLRLVQDLSGSDREGVHRAETRAVVEEALRCMREYPERSLAILTLTAAQRALVQAALTRAFAMTPEAARYRAYWAQGREPFVVKQIDDAQGDVRDLVLLCFGLSLEETGVLEGAGRLEGRFGARRLNVATSRARFGMVVFCGVSPARIRVDLRTPRGVVLLRQFLLFAAQGGVPADAYSKGCAGACETYMEGVLEPEEFRVVSRVGVGEACVDMAVTHPRCGPGFLIALWGDAHAEADEYDWLRGAALERLGWNVYRIWSSEWFRDPLAEVVRIKKLVNQLADLNSNPE